ncbi:MAG TPA: T9SS type A sorting domain-containing protein [Ignavibacteria bacterium]|nr:T9SS type A sorting domain-containing protein [Ignavibacteria bacterium]
MKILFFFLSMLCCTQIFSQGVWIHAGNISQSNNDNVYSMTSNSSGDLFATSWAVGVFKSTDQGMSWSLSGLQGKRVSTLRTAPDGNIYALSKTVDFSYIHRSTDNGNTWKDVDTRSFPLNYAGGGEIVFPSDGSIVASYSVTVGPLIGNVSTFVFKSTDNGNSWVQTQRINAGFIGGMAITYDNNIFLGTSLGGVVYSSNNGNSFNLLNTFPQVFIAAIFKAPDNSVYVSDAFNLHRSTDNGLSFTNAGINITNNYLGEAGVNSNGDLYVSMDDGNVYLSENNGLNWSVINNGLPSSVNIKTFFSYLGKMYCGTGNSGIYYFDNLTSVNPNIENVNEFVLYQNYPNPFNPVTNLKFNISTKGFTSLKIYNNIGREVAVIVKSELERGTYNYNFDASNLPSGIYFYKLTSGESSIVKKMNLIK